MASQHIDDYILTSYNNKNDQIKWKPISLTLVEYPEGDVIGQLLAWISLTPLAIIAGFIALILFRRDLHTITFFLGTVLNEIINLILKYWVKEPRPLPRTLFYTEYGMPSNHAQFMSFFSAYVLLFVILRLHHMNNNSSVERFCRFGVVTCCWVVTFLVCIGRIYLMYHSGWQVFCGIVCGLTLGISWFTVTHYILGPLFPQIVCWRISEFLLLRDTTLIPNVMWFEYTVTRQEARARSRKLVSKRSQ